MTKYRLSFEKTGSAKYMSHLDLMRTFQRVFRRAGADVRHSEGFNPHPCISIVLPLSVGCESVCESLDFECESLPEDFIRRMNAVMPDGLRVTALAEPVKKSAELKYLRCQAELVYDGGLTEERLAALRDFFAGQVTVRKRTKRGESELDLTESSRGIKVERASETAALVTAVLSAQEPTLGPAQLADALAQHAPALSPDFARLRRLAVYDGEMKDFA